MKDEVKTVCTSAFILHPSSFLLRLSDAEAEVEPAGGGRAAAHAAAAARRAARTARHHRDERLDVRDELDGRDAGRVGADRAGDDYHLSGLDLGERDRGQAFEHLLRVHHAARGAALNGRAARGQGASRRALHDDAARADTTSTLWAARRGRLAAAGAARPYAHP